MEINPSLRGVDVGDQGGEIEMRKETFGSVLIFSSIFFLVPLLYLAFFSGDVVAADIERKRLLRKDLKELKSLYGKGMRQYSTKWLCDISAQFSCDKGECKKVRPAVWISIDFSTKKYQRCDTKGCDSRPLATSTSGIYTNIFFAPGTFFKAVNDGSEFVEVVSLGTAILNGFGKCVQKE